jgi:NADH dehydrogenase
VVVVGGGFAGLSAVRELREADVEVLLLDRDPYTTFQPLLYQVATGALNPGDITYALRSFAGHFRNVRFRRACVVGLDPAGRRVRLDDGVEVDYAYLILAFGVTANFFGIPGAAERPHDLHPRRGDRSPRPCWGTWSLRAGPRGRHRAGGVGGRPDRGRDGWRVG